MRRAMFLALLAFAISTAPVLAQNRPGHPANPTHVGKKAGNKIKVPSKDSDHAAIQIAAKACRSAEKAMRAALPIYDGHRHRAMEITKLAIQELRAAYNWRPGLPAPTESAQAMLKRITNVKEFNRNRYSPQQIAKSDEMMRQGLVQLRAALADLGKVTQPFGGYVREASQLIDLAISEATQALQVSAPKP